MFKTIKITDIITVCLLLVVAGVLGYYYANNTARHQLWQKVYPIRADLSNRQLSCSSNAPEWLSDIIRQQTLSGAPSNQIAYIDAKGELYHCENGYTGQYPLLSDPVTEQTRFRYASVTKLWTSDAVLELVRQGKLSLDTKLSEVLTEINSPEDKRILDITIGNLLLHRAGFDRYAILGGQDMFGIGEDICPNHLDKLNDIRLNFTPNEKSSYSNLGYCLLGEVIARQYGKTYTQVISDNYQLTKDNLRFVANKPLADEVFYNHVETGLTGVADIYTAFDYQGLASAAGLSGSAMALAKQVRKMTQKPAPNILSFPDVIQQANRENKYHGYAMYQSDTTKQAVYYRDGGLLGLYSLVAVSHDGQVVALLSNGWAKTAANKPSLEEKLYQILTNAL